MRRARINRTVYTVGLTLASYADADGSRIFPGVARLAFDAKVGYKVASSALAELRALGMVARVRQGTHRGDADEYRLVLPDGDELLAIDVPSPTQARLVIDQMRNRHRGRGSVHPTGRGAPDVPSPVDNSSVHPTAEGAQSGLPEPGAPHLVTPSEAGAPHFASPVHPTPCPPTLQYLDTTTTSPSDEDLGSNVTVPVDERKDPKIPEEDQPPSVEPADESPAYPERVVARARVPRPDRCSHRLPDRDRGDGWSSCALCRVEAVRAPTMTMPVLPLRDPPDGPLADVIPIRRPA
jgi:hypothetical protein